MPTTCRLLVSSLVAAVLAFATPARAAPGDVTLSLGAGLVEHLHLQLAWEPPTPRNAFAIEGRAAMVGLVPVYGPGLRFDLARGELGHGITLRVHGWGAMMFSPGGPTNSWSYDNVGTFVEGGAGWGLEWRALRLQARAGVA